MGLMCCRKCLVAWITIDMREEVGVRDIFGAGTTQVNLCLSSLLYHRIHGLGNKHKVLNYQPDLDRAARSIISHPVGTLWSLILLFGTGCALMVNTTCLIWCPECSQSEYSRVNERSRDVGTSPHALSCQAGVEYPLLDEPNILTECPPVVHHVLC